MTMDKSKQAENAYKSGDYQEAARLYREAARDAESNQNHPLAAEMKNNCSVALLQAGDAAGALEAVLDTDQVFAQSGDRKKQAMALGNRAAALEGLGKLKEAVEAYQQASELLKDLNEPEMRSYVLKNLSALQLRTGSQFEALATMQTALDSQKKLSLRQRFLKKLLEIPFKMGR
jgi:tetratricopeptide (TPR) repeat protein